MSHEDKIWRDIYELEDKFIKRGKRIAELEAQVAASAGLSCPNCDNEGFTSEQGGSGEWYQCQCEFCYTVKDSVFNRKVLHSEEKDNGC